MILLSIIRIVESQYFFMDEIPLFRGKEDNDKRYFHSLLHYFPFHVNLNSKQEYQIGIWSLDTKQYYPEL